MAIKVLRELAPAASIILITILACNLPGGPTPEATAIPIVVLPSAPTLTPTPAITHLTMPGSPGGGKLVYDVESKSTAPERRAPYGDSYDINRLERPFLQDMTYISDLDINTFTVASDDTWWYVSIDLIGSDPNNSLGIAYGVELDLDHDGFGNTLILAHPPYTAAWETTPVQIFQDKNHNTGGLSGEKSDAPITTDGYETLVFNGGAGDPDPDLAWVRINAGPEATIQFAFKKSWSGVVFMLGVIADAGLKDNQKLDYVDRFTEEEAGSPVKDKQYYPLAALHSVDNSCREAFGFKSTGYEPQLCPRAAPPTREPREPQPGEPPPPACVRDPTCVGCGYEWDDASCSCIYHGPC